MEEEAELTLEQAAEALGVHYMTAYRYVRTGILEATKRGAIWQVTPDAVERARQRRRRSRLPGRSAAGIRRSTQVERLQRCLVSGDDVGSWQVVESVLASGADPSQVYLEILAPTMSSIGDGWAEGRYSIADEHRATQVAYRLIGLLGPRFRPRGRRKGTVVLGAVQGDHHSLATALVADLWRSQSVDVIDLGGHTPAECFVETAEAADRLLAVGVSVTTSGLDDVIAGTIDAIRSAELGVPILLGGGGIDDEAHARRLGADSFARSGEAAVELMRRIVDGSEPVAAG